MGSGFTNQSVVEVGGATLAVGIADSNGDGGGSYRRRSWQIAGNLAVQVMTPAPAGGTSSAATLTVLAGVFATKNPQVALYSFSTTARCFRVRRVWNGYDLRLAHLGAEYAAGGWGSPDSCRGHERQIPPITCVPT